MRFDTSFFLNTLLKACGGIPITLLMTLGALAIAFPIGLLVSISRVNRVPVLSQIGAFYVSIIRGTPVIIQIFLIYSIAPNALHDFAKAHNLAIDVYGINPVWYAIFVFGFNTATHFSEIFRSALLAVPKGQKEAAYSLGFSRVQTYVKFILPQAFVVASPSICTASLNMLKNTSLAFMMAVMDITGIAKTAAGLGYRYFEAYLDIFIIYLVICFVFEKLFQSGIRRFVSYD